MNKVRTRFAPSLAYAVAMPYPIDFAFPPPVMMAVLPVNIPIFFSNLNLIMWGGYAL